MHKFMKLFLIVLSLSVIIISGCGNSSLTTEVHLPSHPVHAPYPLKIANYNSREIPLEYTYYKAPNKVIITHAGATELMLELGLDNHILATVAPYGAPLAAHVEKYAKLNTMQAVYTPSVEELIILQPDMIIGWSHQFQDSAFGDVTSWHNRHIATYIMPASLGKHKPTIENSLYDFINDIGKIFAIQDKTDIYIKDYKNRILKLEQLVKDVHSKKTVMVLQNHTNGNYSLYDSSYLISAMISIAGGNHIADTNKTIVSAERVLSYDPDFIIYVSSSAAGSSRDLSDLEAMTQIKQLAELKSMRAIRAGNIINLPFFTVNNGGVRTVDAIEKIAHTLYPEKFKQN